MKVFTGDIIEFGYPTHVAQEVVTSADEYGIHTISSDETGGLEYTYDEEGLFNGTYGVVTIHNYDMKGRIDELELL